MSPARIEAVRLGETAPAVIDLARRAQAAVGQPGADRAAGHLAGLEPVPDLVALGAYQRDRLVGALVGWPCGARPLWAALVRPALAATGHAAWLTGSFEVAELHVEPEFHGTGVGTMLLRSLGERIEQDRLVLQADVTNRRAREFYRRRGFRVLTGPFQTVNRRRALVLGVALPLS
ncbi:ribosomal protein S18 acetylase RimI-like enzyme [Actinoalloteichus hoggarensis]|uniref:Putative acetyltransferase n=1 Tax=Actinoalloteichus hoggarensis TaxID=1470176 RepID=A0A221W8W0_9PSEU|nr:GNAT family N-acetyltransferase [Actinoalloteichus hoggarensis]ASO22133.1 putative acetyltransferase [Actinoalloteichus hoggarensis]MBB5923786.1 ribosomal protein S18 acetylase RimI-like enzyme [Actinoalloteichus hoggarensis]